MFVIDSLLPTLSVVLADSVVPSLPVVKMAHGGLLKVVDVPSIAPSPACSKGVPLNVATNSIMWSGLNTLSVRTLAPSSKGCPPVTTALPPGDRTVADHPAGSPVAATTASSSRSRRSGPNTPPPNRPPRDCPPHGRTRSPPPGAAPLAPAHTPRTPAPPRPPPAGP